MQDQPVTGGTLTKAALVELVADVGDLTKKRAEVIVETVFGTIAESLRRERRLNSGASAAFASGDESRTVAATRGLGTGWAYRRSASVQGQQEDVVPHADLRSLSRSLLLRSKSSRHRSRTASCRGRSSPSASSP